MSSALLCASHSPLLYCFDKEPEDWESIQTAFNKSAKEVKEFDPELVFIFGSDHFNGFFLNLMPSFCIGFSADAAADIGGFEGVLDVPRDLSVAAVEHLQENGFDPAVSHQMTVDHAFSQTLKVMTGELDAVPTVPVFINCLNKPFVPFKRTRMFGASLGAFAKTLNKRVLFLASGGMSHHPRRYYPVFGEGDEAVSAWQMSGGKMESSLSSEEWLNRLDSMHHEGAEMITRGERTASDMRISEGSDRIFLDALLGGDLTVFDSWDQDELVSRGGIGSMELQTWIAATAAHQAFGGENPVLDLYSVAPEIGIACGIVSG